MNKMLDLETSQKWAILVVENMKVKHALENLCVSPHALPVQASHALRRSIDETAVLPR